MAELNEHTYQAHTIKVDDKNVEATKVAAEARKLQAEAAKVTAEADRTRAERAVMRGSAKHGDKKAKMSRPTVEESISESDWSFFVTEWDRYVTNTGLAEEEAGAVHHLWQACSHGLRRALHNDGARTVTRVADLMARVKSLSV